MSSSSSSIGSGQAPAPSFHFGIGGSSRSGRGRPKKHYSKKGERLDNQNCKSRTRKGLPLKSYGIRGRERGKDNGASLARKGGLGLPGRGLGGGAGKNDGTRSAVVHSRKAPAASKHARSIPTKRGAEAAALSDDGAEGRGEQMEAGRSALATGKKRRLIGGGGGGGGKGGGGSSVLSPLGGSGVQASPPRRKSPGIAPFAAGTAPTPSPGREGRRRTRRGGGQGKSSPVRKGEGRDDERRRARRLRFPSSTFRSPNAARSLLDHEAEDENCTNGIGKRSVSRKSAWKKVPSTSSSAAAKKPVLRKRKEPTSSQESVLAADWQLGHKNLPAESIEENADLKRRAKKLRYDESILEEKLRSGAIQLGTATQFLNEPYEKLHARLMAKVKTEQLLINEIKDRNTFTNGFSHDGTCSRLLLDKLLKDEAFRNFFFDIRKSHKVKHCWIAWYGEDGWHPFHRDGRYRGTHRIILSLGCIGKEMWFQQGDSMCGIKLDHGDMVKLSNEGGGVTSSMSHSTCKTGKSILIGIEVDEKEQV